MQKSLAVFSVLIFSEIAAPLCAQEMPWCVKLDVFTKNCAFADYNECM